MGTWKSGSREQTTSNSQEMHLSYNDYSCLCVISPWLNGTGGGKAGPKDVESLLPCNWAGRLTGQAVPLDLAILKMKKKKKPNRKNYSPITNWLRKSRFFSFGLGRSAGVISGRGSITPCMQLVYSEGFEKFTFFS